MDAFTRLDAKVAPLPLANIDTDQIIPKQFLKTVEREGLAKGLFYDLRFDGEGRERPDFVLNRPEYKGVGVLVAGDNFGCGSSREHAPWALMDFGIRCVISTSFADIFYNNCFQNGILPLILPQEKVDILMEDAKKGANARFTIDLPNQEIVRPDGGRIKFEMDPFRKRCLVEGLDAIGLTLEQAAKIATYEDRLKAQQPWLWEGAAGAGAR